jgi:hypothetical protein
MTAKNLRNYAPVLWDAVKSGVYDDLRMQKKIHKFDMTKTAAEAIAHNAAFLAVAYVQDMLTRPRYGKKK